MVVTPTLSIRNRGLLYGDGVFRTLLAEQGVARHWVLHYQKLHDDCAALGIRCPDFAVLTAELAQLLAKSPNGVFKIVVTRGEGQRGYAPPAQAIPTHFWDVAPIPFYPAHYQTDGVDVCFCQLRLSEQPRLAGIKHLNRLENVLAAAEIHDAVEGLMLDAQGRVIEGTRSNVFMVKDGQLFTPDLSRCGVAGLQRQRIIRLMDVQITDLRVENLLAADEVFLVNSVIGVWRVRRLGARHWTQFSTTQRVRLALLQEDEPCYND
jgi:4-amino-4-deoxychorismate lyase